MNNNSDGLGNMLSPELPELRNYNPPLRYSLIDRKALVQLCGMRSDAQLKERHGEWVEQELRKGELDRLSMWSEAVAVGSEGFVEQMKWQLGWQAQRRKIGQEDEAYLLREPEVAYSAFCSRKGALKPG